MEKAIMSGVRPTDVEPAGVNNKDDIDANGSMDNVDGARVYRKIDRRVVPLTFLAYFLQFLDKVIINYANIMGFSTDLGMSTQDFSWMATAFFIAYAVAEFPQGILLQKFPAARVLGINILLWGITICCTAAVQNFAGAVAIRTLLGIFESVISPALIIITANFYTKGQATPRYGLWYCGLGAGQIFGGLISFAAQHGDKFTSFPGWRIMMVAVGAFNLVSAVIIFWFLPNDIPSSKFLTENEKLYVLANLEADQSTPGKRVFRGDFLKEAFLDLQVWLLFVLAVLISIPSGVITTFSSTLIKGFGFDSKTSALLGMPSGVVSIIATLLSTFLVIKKFPRWLGIISMMIPTMIGAGLMSFLPKTDKGGVLAGIYLINCTVAPLALIYALAGTNTAGHTKRVATNTFVAMGFGIANIIGPQTFRANQAPGYIGAKITIFAVNGAAIVGAILLRLLYGYRNSRKPSVEIGKSQPGLDAPELTDISNPAFRYVY